MSTTPKTERLQADIVVIGGGGSGLVAAVAAAENGVKNIIVLEKAARLGGLAWLAIGMMAVESPAQKRLGIKSSRDKVFKEAMEFANWSINPEVVRAYVNKSGEIIGWLEGKGLNFDEVVDIGVGTALAHGFSERQGRYRSLKTTVYAQGPGYVGSTVAEAMLNDCKKFGIKVLTRTKAEKILTNRKGKISGVLASTQDKNYKITTKSVIVSAGSFCGNKEMMDKYFNIRAEAFYHGLPYMTGDGIIMAREAGAAIDERLFSLHSLGPCHHKWSRSVHAVIGRPDMLWVNIDGKRFMDEAISGANAGRALNRQPGQVCYALVDSKQMREIKEAPPPESPRPTTEHQFNTLYEDLDRETAEGKKAWKANTLDELANLLRVNPEVLKETVERYNSFCDNGYDKEFIKDPKYLRPVRTSPFYAILGIQGYSYTLGGIKINERMEALNKAGNTIRGLYATGLNASEWVTANYPQHGGTSLTWAYCSGYIAGENAAKYVLGEMSK